MVSLKEFLFKDKPLKVLIALSDKPKNITQIAKKVGTTYSHTLKLLEILYELEIIEFQKLGREKIVSLTKKGKKVVEKLSEFLSVL
ncbi:MAG: winged helix-turn-helix domain-containing protein [Candidatus Aenigmatarchaeota archaeon]